MKILETATKSSAPDLLEGGYSKVAGANLGSTKTESFDFGMLDSPRGRLVGRKGAIVALWSDPNT